MPKFGSAAFRRQHYLSPSYDARAHAELDILDGEMKSAVLKEYVGTAMGLIYRGANPSIRIGECPLLHHAILKKLDCLLRCCIEHGADLKAENRYGVPPLHFAVEMSNVSAIKILLEYIDVNTPDSEGRTPLFYAVGPEDLEVVTILLWKGAAVNVQNCRGDTPLHRAAYDSRCLWLVNGLLLHSASVHTINKKGHTALDTVYFDSELGPKWNEDSSLLSRALIVRELLVWGSVVNATIRKVVKRLMYDINCYFKSTGKSVEQINGVNFWDSHRRTPLHYAAMSNRLNLARLLLGKGAEIDALDYRGQTPLHLSVSHDCSPRMVMLLIEMGARVSSHSDMHLVRPALARKVKSYLLDFKNDVYTSTLMRAFISNSNCNIDFYRFVALLKRLPPIDCVNFFLAFRCPV